MDGWYPRLSKYAFECVTQAIKNKCDIRPYGSQISVEMTSRAVKSLLARVAMQGLEAVPMSPPFHFPLEAMSLSEWAKIIPVGDLNQQSKFPATAKAKILESRFEDLVDGDATYQDEEHSASGVFERANTEGEPHDEFIETAHQLIKTEEKVEVHKITVRDPSSPQTSKIYAPEITLTDYAFMTGNARAKVCIALEIARETEQRYARFMGLCQRQMDEWNNKIAELERRHRDLAILESEGRQFISTILRSTASKVDAVVNDSSRINRTRNSAVDTDYRRSAGGQLERSRTPINSPRVMNSPRPEVIANANG